MAALPLDLPADGPAGVEVPRRLNSYPA